MKWIIARLREDSTRAAIGQVGVVAALAGAAFGVDVPGLLEQAEASAAKLVAITGLGAAAAVNIYRMVTPDAPPPGTDAVVKAAELLREMGRK